MNRRLTVAVTMLTLLIATTAIANGFATNFIADGKKYRPGYTPNAG